MMIFPVLQLMDGKCVNLDRDRLDQPKAYDVDPVEKAKEYVRAGAQWIYVIDLDGVAQAGGHNADIVSKILDDCDVPIMVAGGIRTMASIEWWIEHGVTRVVLGTAAVRDRRMLMEACARYPGRIAVSVDARAGKVVIEGWREETSFTPLGLAKQLQDTGVSAIIYTDIDCKAELPDSSFANSTELARQLSVPVISSGTVKKLDDLSTLKYLPNISGAVVTDPLYDGTFSLSEAIEVCL